MTEDPVRPPATKDPVARWVSWAALIVCLGSRGLEAVTGVEPLSAFVSLFT